MTRPSTRDRPQLRSVHQTLADAFPGLNWQLHTSADGHPVRAVYQPSARFWIRIQPDTSTRHVRVECRICTEVYDGAESWPCRDDREMLEAVNRFLDKQSQCFRFQNEEDHMIEKGGSEYA